MKARPISRRAAPLLIAVLLLGGSQWTYHLFARQRGVETSALRSIQIRENVWVLVGAGANITVHVGEDGVVLVDSGTAAAASQVLSAIRAITPRRIRLIINTNGDPDHTGGNEAISKTGTTMMNRDVFAEGDKATVLAHEGALLRMSAAVGTEPALPAATWPNVTFTQQVKSMYVNDDAVLVMRQTGAHSDGDSIVEFRRADVIVVGDVLDLRTFPVIDPRKGGSIQGEIEALNRLLLITVPAVPQQSKAGRTLLVPGHGRVSDYAELIEYRDMVTIVRDVIQDMINRGMTLEQVKAANPTLGYRGRYGSDSGAWTTDNFVEAIYNGLKRGKS